METRFREVTDVLKDTQLVNQNQTQRTKSSEDLTMRSGF